MKNGIYFVSGIDTDAGKSYATGFLARRALDNGTNAMTMKFIQTGGVGERGVSIDIDTHRTIMGIDLTEDDRQGVTAPVVFSYPASPHLAAAIDSRTIDFQAIENSIQALHAKHELLLIEGAGGLHVPLKGAFTTIEYIKERQLPLIFITSGKLGSINHTILSLEACQSRNIEVAAVVYSRYFGKVDPVIDNDTFDYLKTYVATHFPATEFIEFPGI